MPKWHLPLPFFTDLLAFAPAETVAVLRGRFFNDLLEFIRKVTG